MAKFAIVDDEELSSSDQSFESSSLDAPETSEVEVDSIEELGQKSTKLKNTKKTPSRVTVKASPAKKAVSSENPPKVAKRSKEGTTSQRHAAMDKPTSSLLLSPTKRMGLSRNEKVKPLH